MRKPDIEVVVVNRDGQYDVGNGKIQRIGNARGKWVSWWVHNNTSTPIHVKIHRFAPGPCPVERRPGDFPQCEYDSQAPGNGALGVGQERVIKGKLTSRSGLYTYEFHVRDAQTGAGNPVDPELQIDDPGKFAPVTPLVATIGLVGGFALAYWWFTRDPQQR